MQPYSRILSQGGLQRQKKLLEGYTLGCWRLSRLGVWWSHVELQISRDTPYASTISAWRNNTKALFGEYRSARCQSQSR
jgi:hypothetical protein